MKNKSILILFLIFAVSTLHLLAQDMSSLKKRVAVVDFEDRAHYGYDIGKGVADMLVTALVESKKFMVIERSELEQVLNEQGLGQSGLVTPQSAAKVGQLLGAEMLVTGSVTEFGEKESKVGGGLGRLGGLNVGVSKKMARVAVDIRLVNVNTGEIIAAKSASGEDATTGLDNVGVNDIDFHNTTTWDNTQLGKASREAIEQCVQYITEGMEAVPWVGKIIKVSASDGSIFMKPGSKGGVKTGMVFKIFRPGEALIDPDTGLSLGSEESLIGEIQVTSDLADGKAAKAIVKSGMGFQEGDLIRIK
jgi:curli biogenesis system outer membrane secretion channel CsgG